MDDETHNGRGQGERDGVNGAIYLHGRKVRRTHHGDVQGEGEEDLQKGIRPRVEAHALRLL